MNCIFVEAKLVDDNGDVHFEKIDTHIDKLDAEIQDIAKNFLDNCRNIVGSDPCERAFSVHKCWKLHDPKVSLPFTCSLLTTLRLVSSYFLLILCLFLFLSALLLDLIHVLVSVKHN